VRKLLVSSLMLSAFMFAFAGQEAAAAPPGEGLIDRDGTFLCTPDPLVWEGHPDGIGVCFDLFPDPEVHRVWIYHNDVISPGGEISVGDPDEHAEFMPGKDGAVRKELDLLNGP
jgi:hypothetical protein